MKFIRKLFFYIIIAILLWLYFVGKNGQSPSLSGPSRTTPKAPETSSNTVNKPFSTQFAKGSVDYIFVDKSAHLMELYSQGELASRYQIALGFSPVGAKLQEGDCKTPEGEYTIDYRNPNSQYHRSLHISYPRQDQVEAAKAAGRKPGGQIMIHGQINGREWQGDKKILEDWTNGCISVSNNEIEEIWRLVRDGAKIKIVK